MNRLNSLALFILLLSVTVYGIIEWRSATDDQESIINNELTPDFIAEILKSKIYTDKGKLSHSIEADRMEHVASLA